MGDQKWFLITDPQHSYNQHVVPDKDLIDHQLTHQCICHPKWNATVCPGVGVVWIFAHEALDGRK